MGERMRIKLILLVAFLALFSMFFVNTAEAITTTPTQAQGLALTANMNGNAVGTFSVSAMTPSVDLSTIRINSTTLSNGMNVLSPLFNGGTTYTIPSILAGGSANVTASVSVGDIFADTYSGTITVDALGNPGNTTTLPLSVIVNTTYAFSAGAVTLRGAPGENATATLIVTNTGNTNLPGQFTLTTHDLTRGSYIIPQSAISLSQTAIGSIGYKSSQSVIVTVNIPEDINYADYTGAIDVTDLTSGAGTRYANVTLEVTESVCSAGTMLDIDDLDIDDDTGDSSDHAPGDTLIVSFTVQNLDSSNDIDDAKVEVWLFNRDTGDKEAEWESDTFKLQEAGDSDDEDEREFDIELQIPPDVDVGDEFSVHVQVYDDEDKEGQCMEQVEDLDLEKESHDMFFDSVSFNPDEIMCGESAELKVKLYNVGDADEDVILTVKNTLLSINVVSEEYEIDEDDDKTIRMLIDVPANAAVKDYYFAVEVEYDDGDAFESETSTLTVVGCGGSTGGGTTGSGTKIATLTSVGGSTNVVQGIESVFPFTIENTGVEATTYNLDAAASGWGTTRVEPAAITLLPGQSVTAYVYVTPSSLASGTQTATVNVNSGGTTLDTQTFQTVVSSPAAGTTTTTSGTTGTISTGYQTIAVSRGGAADLLMYGMFGAMVLCLVIIGVLLVQVKGLKAT